MTMDIAASSEGSRIWSSAAAKTSIRVKSKSICIGHPDIQDVQVFGVPDTKYGEELCAWIVTKAGAALDEEGVRKFCQVRISHYKIPRYIRFVESFPSTVTGKVQKLELVPVV